MNGVLMEKTKVEVVPEMRVVINNLNAVTKQITDTMQSVKQEIKNLESAYDHIMKAAKSSVGQQQAAATSEAKAGGVLV